ncbi:MAG TPA: MoxR family ATPase [Polyangia bacterium]
MGESDAVREQVEGFSRDVGRLRDEVAKVIVGHTPIVEGVVMALLAGGHALLEGVPGLGKTMLVRTLADAVHLTFSRIQFTPDLMPADILGTNVIVEDGGGKRFQFQRGPIFANVVLADEVNRATPKTQSALLEAMQEKSVTVGKTTYKLDEPFFVLATQNPLEMEGTYPLPEAQLDRFFVKLRVEYPSRESMHTILDRTTGRQEVRAEKVLAAERLLQLRELVRDVPIARPVQDFAVRVVEGTHSTDKPGVPPLAKKYVRYGASPRGAQAILLAAKIKALLDGRFAVSTDDIRAVAAPCLRHRLILNFEGEAEGIDPDTIIDSILSETKP